MVGHCSSCTSGFARCGPPTLSTFSLISAPSLAYECPRSKAEPQGHEPETRTPGPAPRRARHRALRAGPVQGAGRRAPAQAVVERDAARAEPGGARGLSRGGRRSSTSIRTARRARSAQAIAAAYGLNPDRIVCGAGSDELLNLIAARLSSARATRRSTPSTASSSTRSPSAPAGGTPVVAPEKRPHRRRRRDPGAGDATARASSSSPIPTTRPAPTSRSTRCGGCTPALPPRRAARPRRGLCRICAAQRLRERHRARGDRRQRRDDAHLLEDLRPRRPPHRLGLRRRRRSSTRSTASAGRSTCRRRRSPPASPRSATAPTSSAPSRTTRRGCRR